MSNSFASNLAILKRAEFLEILPENNSKRWHSINTVHLKGHKMAHSEWIVVIIDSFYFPEMK